MQHDLRERDHRETIARLPRQRTQRRRKDTRQGHAVPFVIDGTENRKILRRHRNLLSETLHELVHLHDLRTGRCRSGIRRGLPSLASQSITRRRRGTKLREHIHQMRHQIQGLRHLHASTMRHRVIDLRTNHATGLYKSRVSISDRLPQPIDRLLICLQQTILTLLWSIKQTHTLLADGKALVNHPRVALKRTWIRCAIKIIQAVKLHLPLSIHILTTLILLQNATDRVLSRLNVAEPQLVTNLGNAHGSGEQLQCFPVLVSRHRTPHSVVKSCSLPSQRGMMPVCSWKRRQMTSPYRGSSSQSTARIFKSYAAIRVLPDPPKGSKTVPPGGHELLIIASIRPTGFMVGCSALREGLSNSNTVACLLSPYQWSPPRPSLPVPPGVNP
nr:MAG TPA: hypothetical protein [Caudoviricetes sp.]